MSFGGFIKRRTYWFNDFISGSHVRSHFMDIKKILNNYEYGFEKQKQHLNNLIDHATKHSSYYKQIRAKSFESFPVMNKQLIRKNIDEIKVGIVCIPGQKGNIHVQYTSGSTGMPLNVPQDTRKRNRRIAELKYFGEIAGYKSHEKMLQFKADKLWLKKKSKIQFFRENIYFANCSQINDEIFLDICNIIRRKKISILYGYPNWFEMFVKFLERNSINISTVKVVIAISELLPPNTRIKLKELLKCDVVSRYSNEEQGILAQDKNESEYFFLNHASYFFEFLKLNKDEKAEPGELSRIVVTDLFNYAFPMIRYDTGDTCIFENNIDNSTDYPVLKKIYGRLTDMIYDTKGNSLHPSSLSFLINYDAVILWQFIQKNIKEYVLKLKLSNDLDLVNVKTQLNQLLGEDARITIELVDDIPLLPSGKRKLVACELNK